MTDYRINLHDCPGIDPATQAAMLNAYRALLAHELSGAEDLITAYHAWQDVMLRCKEWSLPEDAEDENRMACDRWVNADYLPYRAVLPRSV